MGRGELAAGVFRLEVRGEDAFAEAAFDFGDGPEAAAVEFFGRTWSGGDNGYEYVDQLFLARRLEHIAVDEYGREILETEFLASLAAKCVGQFLAVVHVAADGSIPLTGLYVFPFRPLLKIQPPLAVENMEMNYGVEQFRAVVALAARCLACHVALGVYYRKYFLCIVAIHIH